MIKHLWSWLPNKPDIAAVDRGRRLRDQGIINHLAGEGQGAKKRVRAVSSSGGIIHAIKGSGDRVCLL